MAPRHGNRLAVGNFLNHPKQGQLYLVAKKGGDRGLSIGWRPVVLTVLTFCTQNCLGLRLYTV